MKTLYLTYFLIVAICALQGCHKYEYYSLTDYSSVRKADVHVHIRTERNTFSEKAKTDNFKLVNIVVDGAGNWKNIRDQFQYASFQQKAYPEQYQTITSFSTEGFHDPEWPKKVQTWLDSCFAMGSTGIKVWKNIGMSLKDQDEQTNIMLDDDRFDTIFSVLEQQKKLVIGHLGEPLNCWLPLKEMTTNNDRSYFEEHPEYHMYRHPDLPSYQEQMTARDRRLDKHPNLRFIGAHMASIEWDVDTLGHWLDRYPQATIDLAARMGQVFFQTQQNRKKVRNFFIKYQDRILYGTDMGDRGTAAASVLRQSMTETWQRDWKYFVSNEMMESHLINGPFQGIQLPKKVIDKIYFKNADLIFDFD